MYKLEIENNSKLMPKIYAIDQPIGALMEVMEAKLKGHILLRARDVLMDLTTSECLWISLLEEEEEELSTFPDIQVRVLTPYETVKLTPR